MVLQERVQRVIGDLGVKQQAFISEINCSNSTFSRWLNGQCIMSAKKEKEIENVVSKYEKIL
jgi:transcriptional regulator with XRE-family HTH domain